jgi:sugar transferase (PEP-CTERM/EpsH1 system associated)
MRILFLTHRLPYSPNRGDRIRAYHVLQQLRTIGQVDVVSLVHDGEEERQADAMRALADSVAVAPVPRLRNLGLGLLSLMGSRPLTHVLLDAPSIRTAIAATVAAHPPDVVVAFCSGIAPLALEPALARFPLVLDMVDVDSAKWTALGQSAKPPMSWVYRREARRLAEFECRVMRTARTTIAINERERAELHRMMPDARVTVVGNGIDLTTFRPTAAAPREPGVVFCGVMNYAPNEDAALRLGRDIWPLVTARRPDARLWLVGAHPTRAVRALEQRSPTIQVTGSVPDVRPYLWNAEVSVAPLRTARGIQNKVLEALAAELPTVVTQPVFAGLPDQVKGGCILADSDESIADAVVELLARPATSRRELAAQASLDSLSWAEQLQPLAEIIHQAARPSR